MADEKTLLEEILDVRKKRIKNRLLDNDETSENEDFQNKENVSQIKLNDNSRKIIRLEKARNEKIKIEKFENGKTKKEIKKDENINTDAIKLNSKLKEKEVKEREFKEKVSIITDRKKTEKSNKEIKRKKIIKKFFKNRKLKKISFTPYIRTEIEVRNIMKDVIISLVPAIIAAGLVYGIKALLVITVSVFSAVVTEKLFSRIFLNDKDSVHDLSAVITGILLALTLAPLTSLLVVAFGASMAVIFGKLMYGGIGKNVLNPAVVGREFMTVFFSNNYVFRCNLVQSGGFEHIKNKFLYKFSKNAIYELFR